MKKLLMVIVCLSFVLGLSVSHAQNPWDIPVASSQEITKDIVVYRSASCGCCSKWVAHLKKHNFKVQDNVLDDVQQIKDKYGINRSLASCHTAIIDGYIVEGHVPAQDIISMLKENKDIKGLTVPGMVVGTPGMEMGNKKSPFKVMSFNKGGEMELYKSYENY